MHDIIKDFTKIPFFCLVAKHDLINKDRIRKEYKKYWNRYVGTTFKFKFQNIVNKHKFYIILHYNNKHLSHLI